MCRNAFILRLCRVFDDVVMVGACDFNSRKNALRLFYDVGQLGTDSLFFVESRGSSRGSTGTGSICSSSSRSISRSGVLQQEEAFLLMPVRLREDVWLLLSVQSRPSSTHAVLVVFVWCSCVLSLYSVWARLGGISSWSYVRSRWLRNGTQTNFFNVWFYG